jgi:hypothetical protein
MAARIPIMAITTRSSIRVKPALFLEGLRLVMGLFSFWGCIKKTTCKDTSYYAFRPLDSRSLPRNRAEKPHQLYLFRGRSPFRSKRENGSGKNPIDETPRAARIGEKVCAL